MNHLNQHETVDRVLSILANQYCRSTLLCLQEATEDVISVRDLATRITPRGRTDETVVELHHLTIPRLADAGLVEYDSRSDTVRYDAESDAEEIVDAVIDCIPENEQFREVGP